MRMAKTIVLQQKLDGHTWPQCIKFFYAQLSMEFILLINVIKLFSCSTQLRMKFQPIIQN